MERGLSLIALIKEKDSLQRIKKALEQGANPNEIDENGNTALMLAGLEGNLEMAQLLLDHGASVETKSNFGITPLMCASSSGNLGIVKLLVEHGAIVIEKVPCFHASGALHEGAYIAPLHFSFNSALITQFLLNHGADWRILDHFGKTALHYAAWSGFPDVVKVYMDHGADPNILDTYNETPLMLACFGGAKANPETERLAAIKILLANGASITLKDSSIIDGFATKSLFAPTYDQTFKSDDLEIIKTLLNHGAVATEEDFCNFVGKGYGDIIKLILKSHGPKAATIAYEIAHKKFQETGDALYKQIMEMIKK